MHQPVPLAFDEFIAFVSNKEVSLYYSAEGGRLILEDMDFVRRELTDEHQLLLFLNREYETESSVDSRPVYHRFRRYYYLVSSTKSVLTTNDLDYTPAARLYSGGDLRMEALSSWNLFKTSIL